MMIGYARVSRADQILNRQVDELSKAGCEVVYQEVGSGKRGAHRPEWDRCQDHLRKDDVLVVTELSRLGRSTSQLELLAESLQERGVCLRILNLGIDTTTSAGKLIFTIVSGVAQMERELLIERTQSGLEAARARGRVGGRKRSITDAQIRRAQELYDQRSLTMGEIAAMLKTSVATLYRYVDTSQSPSTTSSEPPGLSPNLDQSRGPRRQMGNGISMTSTV